MFKSSINRLSNQGKIIRWGILGFSCTPLFGTYFYNQGYRIKFLVCPIRHFTGIPCPGCGMTGSFMAIARGDLRQAFAENLLGPFLFIIFVITAIHVTLELWKNRQITAFYWQIIKNRKLHIISLLTILIYYILRLYQMSQTAELYFAFIHSPLGKLLYGFNIN